jgi:aminoglycoside phosphotransferase family enzyme
VYRQKQAPEQKNCEEMHHNVSQKMCWTLYRAVFLNVSLKSELLGVKVTTEFHRQCHKNLSLRNVKIVVDVDVINVMILTSKFQIVVSGSKFT